MDPLNPTLRARALLALVFVLPALAMTPSIAGQGTEAGTPDDTGDVALAPAIENPVVPPTGPLPVPLSGLDDLTGPVDLTEVKVYGETATHLSFGYKVVSFSRLNTLQPALVVHRICFTWEGTGSEYQFLVTFAYPTNPNAAVNTLPGLPGVVLERLDAPCDPYNIGSATHRINGAQFVVDVDFEAGSVDLHIARGQLRQLHPDVLEGILDPAPKAGEKLGNVRAYAIAKAGISNLYYDETPWFDYTLGLDTGNDRVKVIVAENIAGARGRAESLSTPMYGVEIGRFQTIPVTIENHLDVPIEPNITAVALAGDMAKWQVRTIPSIPVPAKVGDEPGRETVTLIVSSDPTVVHKESIRLLVSALDPDQPQHLGAAVVDVVAVVPPDLGRKTVYFHGTGDDCNTNQRWMSTLPTDAAGPGVELAFRPCGPAGGGDDDRGLLGQMVTSGQVGRTFHPDVPFARDYVLDAKGFARANIELKSVLRIPGETPTDVPFPTIAAVKVELFSGDNLIGDGLLAEADIPGELAPFGFDVKMRGVFGATGVDVPNEQGLNIRVSVITSARTFEYGGFCVDPETCIPEGEQYVQNPSGKIFMALGGQSSVTLPIVSSTPSGDEINITASGALIVMRVTDGANDRFVNPGRAVVYDLAVRNQGVNADTAKITVEVDRPGWKVEIVPATEHRLRVGEAKSFQVRVVAPEDAREGDKVTLGVVATSKVDPVAFQRVPLSATTTTQQDIPTELPDDDGKPAKKKGSPGVSAMALLAGVAALLALAGRRRVPR